MESPRASKSDPIPQTLIGEGSIVCFLGSSMAPPSFDLTTSRPPTDWFDDAGHPAATKGPSEYTRLTPNRHVPIHVPIIEMHEGRRTDPANHRLRAYGGLRVPRQPRSCGASYRTHPGGHDVGFHIHDVTRPRDTPGAFSWRKRQMMPFLEPKAVPDEVSFGGEYPGRRQSQRSGRRSAVAARSSSRALSVPSPSPLPLPLPVPSTPERNEVLYFDATSCTTMTYRLEGETRLFASLPC